MCTAVLTFVMAHIATTHSYPQFLETFFQEWYLCMLLAQVVSMAIVLLACGRPTTKGQWLAVVAMNLFLLSLYALHSFGELEAPSFLFLQILLWITVIGCWTFAVVGAPIVMYWVWRRSRGVRSPLPLAKWWFGCLILLLAAEPVAFVIKSSRERVNIPVLPVASSQDEFHIAAIGESSMAGWPYVTCDDDKHVVEKRFSIPAVYAWRLRQIYREKKIVMHNIAVPGLSLKLAIEQLGELQHRPDLVLLYAGHNEFY
nr:hypothetical protein [uncultured bacterium]